MRVVVLGSGVLCVKFKGGVGGLEEIGVVWFCCFTECVVFGEDGLAGGNITFHRGEIDVMMVVFWSLAHSR